MKTIRLILLFPALCLLLASSCNDEKTDQWTSATVVSLGDPAVDGCGWGIKINDTFFIPTAIDNQYKQDGLEIEVIYKNTLQTINCPGFSSTKYQEITIVQIKKKGL